MRALHVFLLALLHVALAYRPLQPQVHKPTPEFANPGSPLYLTPYIEDGDIEGGQLASFVDSTQLAGINRNIESYAGLLTVDKPNNGNMFFWFFPAQHSPETAPVVIWLQGGPGGSSMFGLLKLHGAIITGEEDDNGNLGVHENPYSWNKNHNMLYIDNPVGAGFSYSNVMPQSQKDVADNLYEFLQQWFTLFPKFQANDFYPFGESYAGRFVPTIARRIHEENQGSPKVRINLAGMGIGDGWMSPYHNTRYGEFLYQVGLVDENVRDECLLREEETQRLIDTQQWYEAWRSWNNEFSYFMNEMDYSYYYEITQAAYDPSEDNYEDFLNFESTRKAIHVGGLQFGSGNVYQSMLDDFMRSSKPDIEFLLEHYRTLMYDGNFDIICNHSGVLELINALEWSGSSTYDRARRSTVFYSGDVVGYLKKADNLHLMLVRNAGHMVPLSQPAWALDMLDSFTSGTM